MKKLLYKVFSMPMAVVSMLAIAISIAVATFIENDFGTATAQKIIYKAWWFELVLLLFAITLIMNMIRFNLFRLKKIPVLLFHLAGIMVILGAGITRYISYEGLMPIREGKTSNELLSENTYLQFKTPGNDEIKEVNSKVLFGSLGKNSFNKTIDLGGKSYKVKLKEFYPNAAEKLEKDENGIQILNLVHGGSSGRETVFLQDGESKSIGGLRFGFNSNETNDVNIASKNDSLFYTTAVEVRRLSMMTQQMDTTLSDLSQPFQMQHLYYFDKDISIVLSNHMKSGRVVPFSKDRKVSSNTYNAVQLEISSDNDSKEVLLYGNKGIIGDPEILDFNDNKIQVSYGSRAIDLPFSLKLRDFELERYPGSNSASSYASEVTLIDESKNIEKDYRIYMNHVLNYRGFRFFQSSYDPDERGTILSVNHDFWGTIVTYIAYFLLALGMFLTIFSKNTRLRKLGQRISKLREQRKQLASIIILIIGSSLALQAQESTATINVIPEAHAEQFGKILVQDMMGRTKPVNTLSSELIRKLTGRDVFEGQNSDQIMLGMIAYSDKWSKKPIIKVSHPDLKEMLGVEKYASFDNFFEGGAYKLGTLAEEANRISASNRSKLHKDVIKVDERVNILYMIFNGSFLRIFPNESDLNHKWYTLKEAASIDFGEEANLLVHNFLPWYLGNINKAFASDNWEEADFSISGLSTYQHSYGKKVIPSETKLNAEILYNKIDIFGKLISWYGLVGFVLLVLMLIQLFKPNIPFKWPIRIAIALVILGFLYHTFGLGLRWYISGHAPWSNGYESVIYIAWATVLAGLIFSRKSPIVLGATSILAAWILIVSMMSWADPQITNLVPVLKSYWLTIHVSIITSSYGFLAIGAILAFLNLLLIIVRSKKEELSRLTLTIRELSSVIESTLIIGLFLLTIGTFLGGIWANESWGRYWGWDAKETWSMVSILVYSFILHVRFIPGLKTIYAFNLLAFTGFASILMTYFGVNFYLSGLHSYATGDPVPIPDFVYIGIMITVVIATVAYFRQNSKEKIS